MTLNTVPTRCLWCWMGCWCPSDCQRLTWKTQLTLSPRYNHIQHCNSHRFTLLPVLLHSRLHSQIANKAIKLFTTWKLDLTPHVKDVKETLTKIYEKQVNLIFMSCLYAFFHLILKKTLQIYYPGKGEQIWEALWQGEEDTIGQNSWRGICQPHSGILIAS